MYVHALMAAEASVTTSVGFPLRPACPANRLTDSIAVVLGLLPTFLILSVTSVLTVVLPTATFSSELDRDLPIVLTPSRLPQRIDEAPSTVTIIDRALIEASGVRRLVDVLRLVPGFQVGYKSNDLPTATYHGLSDQFARRILLLVDGQRIFQYSRGVIEWNNLPIQLEDIERIEVVRGPDAATYGSNAFAAVVNIQTRSAAENTGLYTRVAKGTDGIADGFFRYGGKVGTLDYSLSLSSQGDDGYHQVPDDRRNNSISFLGEVPVGTLSELTLRAGYSRGEYETEGGGPAPEAAQPRHFPASDNFQSLQWRQLVGRDDELLATLSHNTFHYDDPGYTSTRFLPGVTLKIAFGIDEERYEADWQYSHRFSEQWRAVAGVGYYYEAVHAPYYFATDQTLDNHVVRIFGHSEYRPQDNLVFNAGAMLERSRLSDQWLFLPQLSAHFHLTDSQTVRAIISTGSRQPSLYENQGRAIIRGVNQPLTLYRVYATGIDRGGLDAEINRSYELGYLWQPARYTSLDARLFQENLSHFIGDFYRPETDHRTVLPGNRVLDFANDKEITLRGLEAQLDWRHPGGIRLFTHYALIAIDAAGTRFNAGYEHSAPQHAFGLLVSQDFGNRWQASLNYEYQSEMTWYRENPIHHYHKLDARLAKTFTLGTTRAVAELVGTNLLQPFSDYLPSRNWERGVFLRCSLDY